MPYNQTKESVALLFCDPCWSADIKEKCSGNDKVDQFAHHMNFFLLAGSSRSHRTFYNEEIAESRYFTAFSRSLGSDEAGAGYQIFAQNPAESQRPRQSYSFTLLFEFF